MLAWLVTATLKMTNLSNKIMLSDLEEEKDTAVFICNHVRDVRNQDLSHDTNVHGLLLGRHEMLSMTSYTLMKSTPFRRIWDTV